MKIYSLISPKVVILFLVLFISPLSSAHAQSTNISDYGAKYTYQQGDSRQYKYSRIQNFEKNYISVLSVLSLNSTETYQQINVTQGTIFTVTVTNATQQYPYINYNETIPSYNGKNQVFISFFPFGLVYYSFNNKSILTSYIENVLNKSVNLKTGSFHADDNNLYYKFDYIFSPPNLGITFHSITETVYNWHTGWMQYSETKQIVENNNTVVYDIRVEMNSNDLITSLFNLGMDSLIFGIPVALAGILAFAFINFKRNFKSNSNNNHTNKSFLSYIKTDFKKSKNDPNKKSNNKSNDINKSLSIIEEILEETEKR